MIYLKAYQEYQKENYDQCLKLLQELKSNDVRKLDLQAQVHFQKKDYQKAYDIYQDLIAKGGEYQKEREENLLTVIVCAQLEQPGLLKLKSAPSAKDIIEQIEAITIYDASALQELSVTMADSDKKSRKKTRKRKNKMPKNYDPVAGPDPERWLPRRDRKGVAHKQRKKRQRRPRK